MADLGANDLRTALLGTRSPREISDFIARHGISRLLLEEPYVVGSRGDYLLQRIFHDASGDDAVARVALRRGEVVGLLVVRYPQWDREHFGYVVGRVEHLQGADEEVLECLVDETVQQLHARGARMCSARLSSDALAALHCLERSRFRLAELTLAPWRNLSTWEPKGYGVTRPTRAEDVEHMCAIARKTFRTDRFHRDVRFDRTAADGVYDKWIRSWHAGPSSNQYSRVLIVEGAVAGFVMFEVVKSPSPDGEAITTLVLGGVDPSKSHRGYGTRLWCDVLDVSAGASRFVSATVSAANPTVVNMYAKLGFRLTSSGEVTMHWWSED